VLLDSTLRYAVAADGSKACLLAVCSIAKKAEILFVIEYYWRMMVQIWNPD
jgi:hypothetical protein